MKTIALLFPGQGSQHTGMGEAIYQEYESYRAIIASASEILGYDVQAVINQDADTLHQTVFTQPLLFTVEYALYTLLANTFKNFKIVMLGHSLGEWSAITCAGIISFEEALPLVQTRAKIMQDAVPAGKGAMVAVIGFDLDDLISHLAHYTKQGKIVEIVNYNSTRQVVIAGLSEDLDSCIFDAKEKGVIKRAIPLPVSVPSHSSLLRSASNQFLDVLKSRSFATPDVPVIHNRTAKPEDNTNQIPQLLADQISYPVRWLDSLLYVQETYKPTAYIEIGPGNVMQGIAKTVVSDVALRGVFSPDEITEVKTWSENL